jgi:hypothetical protein|nr:hypothetical protein [uncultured Capnocytophaga sp.]
MRVFLKCKNCGYENSCATETTSRVEFAMQEGEYKKITCKNCNYSHQYQPNDFYAKTSKVPQIIALSSFVVGMTLLIYSYITSFDGIGWGMLILIPSIIYIFFIKEETRRVSGFNRISFRRK